MFVVNTRELNSTSLPLFRNTLLVRGDVEPKNALL
jgi:hypothetical protein